MSDVSRRDFLKGSAVSALGIAAAASVPGCAAGEGEASASAAQTHGESAYRTVETDVVVVGGGTAGTMAARTALSQNVNVLILDKGLYGHSGASGINWGTWLGVGAAPGSSGNVISTDGLIDQEFDESIAKTSEEFNPIDIATKSGSVYDRGPDGEVILPDMPFLYMPRLLAAQVKNMGAKVMDRTMVTDILTAEDGSACGVVALDLIKGEPLIVRSKAVIFAAGSSSWCYGWVATGAKTNSSPECTGDAIGILMKNGQKCRNFENTFLYFYPTGPDSIAFAQSVGVQASDHAFNLLNEEGIHFMKEAAERSQTLAENMTALTYWRVIMDEILKGSPNEKGGFYLEIDTISNPGEWKSFNRRQPEDFERAFGYPMPNPFPEGIVPYSTPIRPELNPETCETNIPGLFYAGECEEGIWPSGWCSITGHLGALAASKIAKSTDSTNPPIQEKVDEAIELIYSTFENKVSGGKRPMEIQHEIQNIVYDKAFYLATEQSLNEAITELKRIKEEELPAMRP